MKKPSAAWAGSHIDQLEFHSLSVMGFHDTLLNHRAAGATPLCRDRFAGLPTELGLWSSVSISCGSSTAD